MDGADQNEATPSPADLPRERSPFPGARLKPMGQRSSGGNVRPDESRSPAEEVIEAIVALAEARASWEERLAALMELLEKHDRVVDSAGGERLPRPPSGPWLFPEHAAMARALAARKLGPEIRRALARETEDFTADWYLRLSVERQRRAAGGGQLGHAS